MGEVSEKWSWRSHEGFKDEGTYYHYDDYVYDYVVFRESMLYQIPVGE